MKRLVAFGCSHTYGESLPDCQNQRIDHIPPPSKFAWPEILAGKLNINCFNKALPGISNKQISYNILNEDLNTTDLVVVLWTAFTRSCIFTNGDPQLLHPSYASKEYTKTYTSEKHKQRYKFNLKYYREFYHKSNLIHESLQSIDHTKKYLDSKGIKSYHFNYERSIGHDPIDSLWPKALPSWFDVQHTTVEMINDYGSDNHHPGVKAQKGMAVQMYKSINSY